MFVRDSQLRYSYTEFIMADGSGKPRYENMETRRVRIETQINMATPGKNMFTAPVLLTENYIPGASLHGRKPAEMKKADLLFWLRCRGDSCKGMTVKAQLVKRYVCIQFFMFYKKRLNPLFFFRYKTNPLNQNLIF